MRILQLFCISIFLCSFIILACTDQKTTAKHSNGESDKTATNSLKIENLLRESMALADSVELIMSYLEVPKNTTLPAHYHPGEEYVYMMEGSGELILGSDAPIEVKAGDAIKIPFEQIHSFSTLKEDSKIVVFRVHKEGQPDRILVE